METQKTQNRQIILRKKNEAESIMIQDFKLSTKLIFVVVQSLSHVQLFVTPRGCSTHQASLSFTISQSMLKLVFIESVMLSNHLILCHALSSCPQSFPASGAFPISQLFTSGGQSIKLQSYSDHSSMIMAHMKNTHRSVEQNRQSRNEPTFNCFSAFWKDQVNTHLYDQ